MSKRSQEPANTRRCAIYTRKSTTAGLDQAFTSLDAQWDACAGYIAQQPGWKLVKTRYDDGGFTGANIERPAFQRLLCDIDAGNVDVVVVYKVDRLSRSLLDFARVMGRFNAAGASFVSVTQNFSTANAMGRLTLNMLMSFSEFEREMISERTRDKIVASRKKGKWTGGAVPFGYRTRDKRLIVDDVEAEIVREAFSLFLQHRRQTTVARELNENYRQRRWSKDSVGRMLRNPIYAGYTYCNGARYPAEHDAIVDEETFDQAQRLLAQTRGQGLRGTNPDYVLRGLLTCGKCGAAMTPASTRKGGRTYRYYRCSTRDKHGKLACEAPPLAAAAIEKLVVEQIAELATDRCLVETARRQLMRRLSARRRALEAEKKALPSQIAATSAKVSKLTEQLIELQGAAREAVKRRIEALGQELCAAESQLERAHQALAALPAQQVSGTSVMEALKDFHLIWTHLTSANRARLLQTLVDRVVVDESKNSFEVHLIDFTQSPQEAA